MITQKPPTSLRNPFGPRADRLSVALPIDSGSGSSLTDLGLGYPVTNPPGGDLTFDPVVIDNGGFPVDAWESDSEGSYLHLDVISEHLLQLFDNLVGETVSFPRGTIMIRFSFASLIAATLQPIFSSGFPTNTFSQLEINKFTSDNIIRITHSTSPSDTIVFDLAWDSSTFDTVRTLIYTWGERENSAWLDNEAGTVNTVVGNLESTTEGWVIRNGQQAYLGLNHNDTIYGDLRLYTFCMWDYQLHEVEREELFVDAYLPFRPRALDFTGSDEIEILATDVNPMPCRPRLNPDSNTDEITFSVVTSKELVVGFNVYMRILYSTSPILSSFKISPVSSQNEGRRQLNVVIDGLREGTKYFWLAQYSVDGNEWFYFPGGRGRFYTQNRHSPNFTFASISDDHICSFSRNEGGPPDDFVVPYVGYGGDIIRHRIATGDRVRTSFYAWRSHYDIYINQDPHFIVHGGDYYFARNGETYNGDVISNTPYYVGRFYRNWCNLIFKSGVLYTVQGNWEGEGGFSQRQNSSTNPYIQLRATVARKTFFPNPQYDTYPQGGENETPTNPRVVDWIPADGNDWVPAIDSSSSTEGDQLTPGTSTIAYNQAYRDEFVLGTTGSLDPNGQNRSPLENYYAWTWGDALFVVLDIFRYTEPGDPLNTGGEQARTGPGWRLGETQKRWLLGVLSGSTQKRKFVWAHHLVGGESISAGGASATASTWYGRGSGINIKRTTTIDDDFASYEGTTESPEEIEIHEMFKKFRVTAFIKGHDHKFSHVINEDVNYITVGTYAALPQWETIRMRESYGHTEETDSPTGNRLSLGVVAASNNYSYGLFQLSANDATYCNRVCAVKSSSTAVNFSNDPLLGSVGGGINTGAAWAGPLYTADSALQIALSERPFDIYTIAKESDTRFNSSLVCNLVPVTAVDQSINLWPADGIDDDWEEFHGSNILTLDASSVGFLDEDVRVLHVPVDFTEQQLLNAVPEPDQDVSLHNVSPETAIYVYNINLADSQEVAEYYRNKRNLPAANLIGLDMSIPTAASCETPISKAEFESTILIPLRESIAGSDIVASGGFQCAVIILGFGTPLSYTEDDGEVIAVASRLHRINHDYERRLGNHTYDRRGSWKFYDTDDSSEVCLTAVLDGPTANAVKKLIDRSLEVSQLLFVSGKIYVDPFGKKDTVDQIQYQADIQDFVDNEAPNLGLAIETTVEETDPDLEPTVASLKNDSFYWGWFNPTYSKDLFLNQNEKRVFLYNADDDGACQIHFLAADGTPFDENGSDPWVNLAINVEPGYAATAGSIGGIDEYGLGETGEEAYLRPRPFFEALHQGASLAEAFLFSSRFVNWKIILVGDPLMTLSFSSDLPPDQDPSNSAIDNNEVIRSVKESIEIALGWGQRQLRLIQDALNTNVDSQGNIAEEVHLLYGLTEWRNRKNATTLNEIYNTPILGWLGYIFKTTQLTLDDWLVRENVKITERLQSALASMPARVDISTDFVYTEGEWEYVFVYTHPRLTFENVHFELEISLDIEFTSIVANFASRDDIDGWKYEQESNIFVQLVSTGFPSNFSGRRVKFVSNPEDRLLRTEIFYVRWRAVETDGTPITDYVIDADPLLVYK